MRHLSRIIFFILMFKVMIGLIGYMILGMDSLQGRAFLILAALAAGVWLWLYYLGRVR